MDCIQIEIETKTEAVEAISYFIIDELEGGIEICDPKDVLNQDKTQTWYDLIDDSLLEGDMDTVIIKAYFNEGFNLNSHIRTIQEKLQHIGQFLDVGTGRISVVEIPEEKWANEWKRYYKVFNLGKNIVIKPSWLQYEQKEGEIIIEMDPGMAFGTGTHETTAMCVELIESHLTSNNILLDIGTGSGILGIVAAKLGASKVVGVDIDPMAVKVANENIEVNGVGDIMSATTSDLWEALTIKGDIVVSNIIADVIISIAPQVDKILKEDGIWIASGIINTKKDDVIKAIKDNNWNIQNIVEQNEWIAVVCTKGTVNA